MDSALKLNLLNTFFCGLQERAATLAEPHLGASEGVSEFILGLKAWKLKSYDDAWKFMRAAADQGYFRGFYWLGYMCWKFPSRIEVNEVEEQCWNDPRWLFSQAFSRATDAYDRSRSQDAAAFLGEWLFHPSFLDYADAAPNRTRGLKLLEEAYHNGLLGVAQKLAHANFVRGDRPTCEMWGRRADEYVAACEQSLT